MEACWWYHGILGPENNITPFLTTAAVVFMQSASCSKLRWIMQVDCPTRNKWILQARRLFSGLQRFQAGSKCQQQYDQPNRIPTTLDYCLWSIHVHSRCTLLCCTGLRFSVAESGATNQLHFFGGMPQWSCQTLVDSVVKHCKTMWKKWNLANSTILSNRWIGSWNSIAKQQHLDIIGIISTKQYWLKWKDQKSTIKGNIPSILSGSLVRLSVFQLPRFLRQQCSRPLSRSFCTVLAVECTKWTNDIDTGGYHEGQGGKIVQGSL